MKVVKTPLTKNEFVSKFLSAAKLEVNEDCTISEKLELCHDIADSIKTNLEASIDVVIDEIAHSGLDDGCLFIPDNKKWTAYGRFVKMVDDDANGGELDAETAEYLKESVRLQLIQYRDELIVEKDNLPTLHDLLYKFLESLHDITMKLQVIEKFKQGGE